MEPKDILVEIADEDLVALSELYKRHVDWAPQVFNFIKSAIRWKKSEKHRHLITFMSPNNSWRADGTIIVLMEFFCYDLFVFTLDKDCRSLYNGLMETTKINFNKQILFFATHSDHVPTVHKVLKNKNLETTRSIPCVAFSIPIEDAKKFVIECPSEVYIKKLPTSSVHQVNSVWPHRYPGSDNYLATLVEMNSALGVFLKSSDELAAWVLTHTLGNLGMLQTEEKFKKKGYGSLITKALSKDMAEEGVTPFGTVLVENSASINMFKKLGFRDIGICTYITVLHESKNN